MKTWVEELITEYGKSKLKLEKYRNGLNSSKLTDELDSDMMSEMISDMNFALTWLNSGRRPWNRRGVEQHRVYQRNELAKVIPGLVPLNNSLSYAEKQKLIELLLKLSARERQCFLLHSAQGLTFTEIAVKLGVSKAAVQKFVNRARAKLQQGL